jgi:PAS domain S-box-containing protein
MQTKQTSTPSKSGTADSFSQQLVAYFWALVAFWTFLSIAALAWSYISERRVISDLVEAKLRSHITLNFALRRWITSHGGVYVPITEQTPPNPYLSHIQERDITTSSGKHLTLMNPAYAMRQLNQVFSDEVGIAGHLTSLKPLRPENLPDAWERKALESFEHGAKEALEYTMKDGVAHLRLMMPFITEKGCLKCHAHQGYKEGDIRGGLSVSVQLKEYEEKERKYLPIMLLSYTSIWIVGLGMIGFGFRKLRHQITRRVESESAMIRLGVAVNSAGDGIVITDADGVIEYINPAYEEITGYRVAELRGLTSRVLKSGRHDRHFYEDLWNTIKAGRVWRGHIINRKKDGSLYEENMTISPITDAGGNIVNFVCVKHDITSEVALQKARDYFTSISSHELRTPLVKLQIVKIILDQIVTGDTVGAQIETARGALLESLKSFDRIVNASSIISDITHTGAERPFVRDIIYNDVMMALENARGNIGKASRNVGIQADMSELPPQTSLLGNHVMIQQALDEAISNAIKFTPNGKTIHVRAGLRGGVVQIEVADEGDGIPPDKLQDVFIPYYSLENPQYHSSGQYNYHGGGIGLGLTLAKLIMEYHNGTLTIGQRAEGAGTLVTLTFPTGERRESERDRSGISKVAPP